MADEENQFVIYTTENFEMTDLMKELEEKKVEIIYLKELLEAKDEEIKMLKDVNAKLETLKEESAAKRKRVDSMNESREPSTASSTQKMKVPKTEDGKEILKLSPINSKEIKVHLCHDSSSCNDISTHRSQRNTKSLNVGIKHIENNKSSPHTAPFKVTRNTLIHVHERYQRVLDVVKTQGCSNRQAYKIAGIPRSTVRDMIGIAELHIVDKQEYEVMVNDMRRASSVKNIERACRRKLGEFKKKMSVLRAEGKLLPIVFNDEFYNCAETRK